MGPPSIRDGLQDVQRKREGEKFHPLIVGFAY